jgi:hypothetical protein
VKSILLVFLSAWFSNVTSSEYVNSIEPLLVANREIYLGGPHTAARQQAALQYFDQQWAYLKSSQACSSRLLGAAGADCLADRSRTGKWPWEVYYRDPIADAR